ncbi:hypothetical protein G9A89_021073 [Geosiphon pyriformis]|nr:hypothetical protein G9A89_021073 [Geosiphon pyriformis]
MSCVQVNTEVFLEPPKGVHEAVNQNIHLVSSAVHVTSLPILQQIKDITDISTPVLFFLEKPGMLRRAQETRHWDYTRMLQSISQALE